MTLPSASSQPKAGQGSTDVASTAASPTQFTPILSTPPAVGCIIGCYTPDIDPQKPGAKFRPVFLLEIANRFQATTLLRVAYGTGQATSTQAKGGTLNPWEVEFLPQEGGLRIVEATRIDLSQIFYLEFAEEFFMKDRMVANYGKVPNARVNEIKAAIVAGEAQASSVRSANAPKTVIVERRAKRTIVLPRHDGSAPSEDEKQ